MKTLIATLAIAAALAAPAHAAQDVFQRINETAPLADVFQQINEAAPLADVFQRINESAPAVDVFGSINDRAQASPSAAAPDGRPCPVIA